MKRTTTGGLLLSLLLAASTARAQYEDYEAGMGEVSLNAGFALPLGNTGGNGQYSGLSNAMNFGVPFGIEVGYRIAGAVFVGGTFTYAPFGSPSSNALPECGQSGTSCSSNFIRAGFSVQWHPLGSRGTDPYVGLGAGYEWLNVNISADNITVSAQYSGFIFADIPVGIDFRLAKAVRFGPYVDLAFGEYRTGSLSAPGGTGLGLSEVSSNISPKTLHFWLSFGLRIVFLGF
jgi:hypothetical protein